MLVQQRRAKALLDYIDGLPGASRTREAILNDPEQAALIADMPESEEPWAPSMRDWTLEAAIGKATYDRLGVLINTLEGTVGVRGRRQDPFPSPTSLVEAIRKDRVREAAEDIIAAFGGR